MLLLRAGSISSERLRSVIAEPRTEPFWLAVDSNDEVQHATLSDVFRFHPLAIEDTLNPRTRVKLEEYDGYFFIVLRGMRLDPERPLEPGKLDVKRLCLFLGPNYLVSVHAGASPNVEEAMRRIESDPALLASCEPAKAAYFISDAVIDAYFPVLDEVDDYVDELERSQPSSAARGLERSLQVRRLAFAARRSLLPQREIFDVLAHRPSPLLSPGVQLYFRDVYDHVQRISDTLEAYRELISDTTDSYVARSSMRLGYTTAILSAIATVLIPFLIISGIYGMNFSYLPLAHSHSGFWIILGLQVVLSCVLLALLRWRHLV